MIQRLIAGALLLAGISGNMAGAASAAEQGRGAVRPLAYIPLLAYSVRPAPAFEDQVIALINQHRAAAGCPALTRNLQLTAAAEGHSQDMAANNFFGHTGSNGSTFVQRAEAAGYPISVVGGAENLAAGQNTPQDVVSTWMSSAGHRANIVNCSHRATGVGYVYQANDTFGPYRHYWTQLFGGQ